MGLQVRIRHALGDRLMELPSRGSDQPIIVGRAAESDVQVPSAEVAGRHCVLYVSHGQWVVQDVPAGAGKQPPATFVNGNRVSGAVHLKIGDVVRIGPGASGPSIDIEPGSAAEGRTGWAGDEAGMAGAGEPPRVSMSLTGTAPGFAPAVAAAPTGIRAVGQTAPGRAPLPGRAVASRTPPGMAPQVETEAAAAPEETVDWLAAGAASTGSTPAYRARKLRRKQSSPVGLVIVILVGVGIIGGTSWVVLHRPPATQVVIVEHPTVVIPASQPATRAVRVAVALRPSQAPAAARRPAASDIPGGNGPDAPPARPGLSGKAVASASPVPSSYDDPDVKPSPTVPTTRVSPKPVSKPPGAAMEDSADAGPQIGMTPRDSMIPATKPAPPPPPPDPLTAATYDELAKLDKGPTNPGIAIFRIDDFQKAHPTEHTQDVADMLERRFDLLWWQRLDRAFKRHAFLTAEVAKKQDLIFEETDPKVKATLKTDKKNMEAEILVLKDLISSKMAYKDDKAPDVANPSALADLSKKRKGPATRTGSGS